MENKSERQKLAVTDLVSRSFRIVMVVLYIALGTTIIFKADRIENVEPSYARLFGILLIAYGILRGYQVYRKLFSKSELE